MPTTPSPYNYNRTRYKKVSKKAQSGGLCGVIVLGAIVVLGVIVATPVIYFV